MTETADIIAATITISSAAKPCPSWLFLLLLPR